MNWSDFYDKVLKSNRVLLIVPAILDLNTICSVSIIYYLFQNRNIKIDVAYGGKQSINGKYAQLLELVGINKLNIISKIDPVFYNIIIPDVTDVNVNWFVNDGNLNIRLVSEKKPIDFNFISFNKSGGLYDLVILLNSARLEDLGSLYSDHPDRLSKFQIISVGADFKNRSDYNVQSLLINENSGTLTYLVKNLLETGVMLDENILKICVIGLAWQLLYMKAEDIEGLNLLTRLCTSYDINYKDLIAKYIFDSESINIRLREVILRNLKLDTVRKIAYSVISLNDLSNLGIDPLNFDFTFYINLNLDLIYEFVFLVIEQRGYSDIYILNNINNTAKFIEVIEKLGGVSNNYFGYVKLPTDTFNAINKILGTFGINNNVVYFESNKQQDQMSQNNDNHNNAVNSISTKQEIENVDSNVDSVINNINSNSGNILLKQSIINSPFSKASKEMIDSAFDPNATPLVQKPFIQGSSPFERANI